MQYDGSLPTFRSTILLMSSRATIKPSRQNLLCLCAYLACSSTFKMDVRQFEALMNCQTTRSNIPEGSIVHSFRRKDLKSRNEIQICTSSEIRRKKINWERSHLTSVSWNTWEPKDYDLLSRANLKNWKYTRLKSGERDGQEIGPPQRIP